MRRDSPAVLIFVLLCWIAFLTDAESVRCA
jgi:hypothetical protein